MKKRIFFTVMASLCLNFWVCAQRFNAVVPLKVGDKLPEAFWQQIHDVYADGKNSKITLTPFKDQLMLLDFWASWCSSCLKKWPLLDSVQNQYGKQIKILLVNESRNGDNLEKVKLKLDAREGRGLQSIYADSLLGMAFPHQLLPNYVWISEKGTVLAITGADFMQKDIIDKLLRERLIRQNKSNKNTKKL